MRYAARLNGDKHTIERIAPYFSSAVARIRQRGTEWILESDDFYRCKSGAEAFMAATALISRLNEILSLYLTLHSAFSTDSILELNDEDHLFRRHLRATLKVNVIAPPDTAFSPAGPDSLGTRVLSRAASDTAIRESLTLVGHEELTWARIYDIIEFLGGADAVARSGLAGRSEARRVRQTANHYRHLGRRKSHPLPANPPSLHDARLFATQILKTWIARRL
jgi:hypothetical protein